MNFMTEFNSLTGLDAIAVGLLVAVWLGLTWWIEHPTAARPSVTIVMSEYRREWMRVLITRDTRIFDAQIIASLRQGTAFFASTSLLAVGGVLALIGNVEPLRGVAEEITMVQSPILILQIKLGLVLLLLGNAFLKFVWSNRVFGYCSVMIAAVPNDPNDPMAQPMASKAAELNIRSAMNFNRGLRSMYFALGAVAWLAGPIALLGAVVVTAWVIWSREFASVPRAIIMEDMPDDADTKA
ncbi:DUF599 domain-containing protein [Octadecabacter sp. G9-8]|uniref:DUF599 domain-containing protein n=1 Tax=Octadecabacter dasysiphoniae TaxID=2909341 RepID=A0ABS9CV30_9RHOB|nr:DUF599 domain-containing protein [Octadecabacter dasysiphoniae]MCF2871018.1 DUF599 domain-containing protein [Octadecabacter dasysiphoniae]